MKYPRFIGRNKSKLNRYFRLQKQHPVGDARRYPVGRYPFRVDVSFGSLSRTRPEADLRLNESEAIKNSMNKLKTKEIWSQAERGIPQVENYARLTEFVDDRELDVDALEARFSYPFVAKRISRSGGEGLHFIMDIDGLANLASTIHTSQNSRQLLEDYYIEDMFVLTHEYRIHVAPVLYDVDVKYTYKKSVALRGPEGQEWAVEVVGPTNRNNGVIVACRKMIRQEAWENGRRHRSLGDGTEVFFKYNFTRPNCWEEMCDKAVEAIAALNLDFGFVDVLYNNDTGEYVFCESGTNPGMEVSDDRPTDNITAQHYVQAFPHIILQTAIERGIYTPPSPRRMQIL